VSFPACPPWSDKRSLLPPGRPASASLFCKSAIPPFRAGSAYLFGIFKRSVLSQDVLQVSLNVLGRTPMLKQEGKIGAIRRNVHGKACSGCGSRSYQLVLRSVKQSHVGKLYARCTQCHRPREIDEDLGRILWM
jgi:hypothetical protein